MSDIEGLVKIDEKLRKLNALLSKGNSSKDGGARDLSLPYEIVFAFDAVIDEIKRHAVQRAYALTGNCFSGNIEALELASKFDAELTILAEVVNSLISSQDKYCRMCNMMTKFYGGGKPRGIA